MRGKIVQVAYFEEQGLTMFLDKLKSQGWLDLFINTQMGCSVPELAEFYANCMVTDGVATSEVSRKKIPFDAKKLGDILGIPATRFGLYVWKDKSMLGKARLLELAKR